jgi:hypothetical protein
MPLMMLCLRISSIWCDLCLGCGGGGLVLGAGCCVGLGARVAWVMVKGLDGVRIRRGRDWLVVTGDGDGGGVLDRDEAKEVLGLLWTSSTLW